MLLNGCVDRVSSTRHDRGGGQVRSGFDLMDFASQLM
jgi:hypothetical protein